MKRIFTISLLCMGAIMWMSNADGRASSQNTGNTGAPGDEMIGANARTCQTCHSTSSEITTLISLKVKNAAGDEVSTYTPGSSYRVIVSHAASGAPVEYGFQMVALKDADDSDVAGFANPSANTQVATANSRQYIEQNGPSTESSFEADWIAPAVGSGDVTFYFSGNAVDGNNMNSGDGADTKNVTLTEMSTSRVQTRYFDDLNIFPNPSNGLFEIRGFDTNDASYALYNLVGQKIRQNGFKANQMDFQDLNNGVYLLQITSKDNQITKKISIQH